MNELQIFKNEKFGEIRTVEENGKVLFCGSDVAKALGYTNPTKAINDHCRGIKARRTNDSLGRQQEINFITEGDIYRLAAKSKLPGADEFESWIFDEVLPSIRKHGAYMTDVTIDRMIASPEFGIQLLTALKEEQKKRQNLEMENAQQRQMIAEYSPKASYYDVVLQTKDLTSASQISKDYGKSAKWLNSLLHDLGVQYKQGNVWLLYQKYAEMGYTKSKTHTYSDDHGTQHSKLHTYWTQKGRLFIYDLLKQNGYYPLIEIEAS